MNRPSPIADSLRALSEVDILAGMQELVDTGDPRVLDPFGERLIFGPTTKDDRTRLLQQCDELWGLFEQLPLPTRRSLDPDIVRAVMCLVTPNISWKSPTHEEKYATQAAQAARWEQRLRNIISGLEYAGNAIPMDYAVAMHRLSLLGSVQTVSRIHTELVKLHPEIIGNLEVSSRTLDARLKALQAWANNINDSHRPISIASGWRMNLWDRNRMTGGAFAAESQRFGIQKVSRKDDFYRRVEPLDRVATVDAAAPSALNLLWSALQDVNAQADFFKEDILKRIVDTMRLVRSELKGRDGEAEIGNMIQQTLEGPFGINMQYLCPKSVLPSETEAQPAIPLGSDMVVALVEWFGHRGELWKMIAAAEIFAKLQPYDDSRFEPSLHQFKPMSDESGRPYFESSSSPLDQSVPDDQLEDVSGSEEQMEEQSALGSYLDATASPSSIEEASSRGVVLLPGEVEFWDDLWLATKNLALRRLVSLHRWHFLPDNAKPGTSKPAEDPDPGTERLRASSSEAIESGSENPQPIIPTEYAESESFNPPEDNPFLGPAPVQRRSTQAGHYKRAWGKALKRARKALRELHTETAELERYDEFYPQRPYPLDLVRRILPFPSKLSPNIYVSSLNERTLDPPTDIASDELFKHLLRATMDKEDWRATMVAFRMWIDAIETHHSAFIREMILKHDRARLDASRRENNTNATDTADPETSHLAWSKDILPPRVSYVIPTILGFHNLGRKRYNTMTSKPSLMLREIAETLRSSLVRLKEEHFILTGRAETSGQMTKPEYDRAMTRAKVYNPTAPFAELFNGLPTTPSEDRPKRISDHLDPRNYCYWLSSRIDRLQGILDRNLGQRLGTVAADRRRSGLRRAWRAFAGKINRQGGELPPSRRPSRRDP